MQAPRAQNLLLSEAITELLADSERALQMGIAAHRRVQQQFLGRHHLGWYFEVIRRIVSHRERH